VEQLGEGWDLGVVREAAYKALAEVRPRLHPPLMTCGTTAPEPAAMRSSGCP
jgi:hypothetical protein